MGVILNTRWENGLSSNPDISREIRVEQAPNEGSSGSESQEHHLFLANDLLPNFLDYSHISSQIAGNTISCQNTCVNDDSIGPGMCYEIAS